MLTLVLCGVGGYALVGGDDSDRASDQSSAGATNNRERLHIMLLDCPTTCTTAEREAQDNLWFETEGPSQVFDETTVYRHTLRNEKGLYALEMSHYFGPTAGGPLRWQVGVYVESPEETQETIQKIVNDIRSQTP